MIKVLLVDDEKLALEYLEHIIDWEYHGFELIGVTTNPEQALAIYKTHRPDLVISDVKMPGLNGLELGDAIREYGGNTHILFLSAYKNFDYVKQAIRLGIDDYILKSDLEEDGFLRKILKLKEEIIKEKAKKQYTITAILEELFRKNISEEVYKDILDENDYIGLHKKYYYIIVSQRKVPKILKKYIPLDNNQMTLDNRLIKRACENVSENTGIHVGARFPVNEDEYLILLEFGKGIVSQKEINDRIYDFARKLYEYINREEKLYHVYYCLHGSMVRQFRSNFTNYQRQLENNILKNEVELQELRYDGKEENEGKIKHIELSFNYPKDNKEKSIYILTKHEQNKITDYVLDDINTKNIGFLISLYSGIRIGELCALQWKDIDFKNNKLIISKTIQRVYIKDKDKNVSKVIITTPKTKNANREIPINKDFMELLKPLKTDKDNYILSNNDKYIEPRTYRKYFNKILNELKINHFNFHSLRHTFATNCISLGCDYKTVSELLGHANVNITLNLYVHPRYSQKKKCIDLISKVFQEKVNR